MGSIVRSRKLGLNPMRIWRYVRAPDTPWGPKLAVGFALAYLLFPLDLIPDVPLIGFLDDLGVFAAVLAWISQRTEPEPVTPE